MNTVNRCFKAGKPVIPATDIPNQKHKKELSKLNLNCLGCHNDGTFYSARPEARAVSTVVNVETLWNDDVATSTTSFACSTCHSSETSKNHMAQNGGLFDAAKSTPQLGTVSCTICHGVGGIADVGVVHSVEEL